MSLSHYARKAAWLLALAVPCAVFADGSYTIQGTQYPITPSLPGEQVHPSIALTTNAGFLVWEDNITDGYGLGISAQRLDSGFSPAFAPFRVNASGAGDQEHPQVSMLNSGGAAFTWQGGPSGYQHIYARFMSSSYTWVNTNDVLVNGVTNKTFQSEVAMTTLSNGNVVVVYSSMNQVSSNSMKDVYGQILSPTGQKVGTEFLVNQYSSYNQRAPSVAALKNGGFAIVWVSEQQRSGSVDNVNASFLYNPTNKPSVDIFGRLFSASGAPVAGEFLINTNFDICSNPSVAGGSDGGFLVAWAAKNPLLTAYSWDIWARGYSSAGVGGQVQPVNTYVYGDQYVPRVAGLGTDYIVSWTSLAQDGSREGVFNRVLRNNATPLAADAKANTTTISQQMHPAVASDGFSRFVTVWTSFVGGTGSFDLFAQRYVNNGQPLVPMNAPFVFVPYIVSNGAYQPQIKVSWPLQTGLPIDHYELFVDGGVNAAASLTTNTWTLTGISPNTTHSFQIGYVTVDARHSPLSPAASATTWLGTTYAGQLPVEWVAQYYGYGNPWPGLNSPLAPGGPTLLQVFLTGGNPLDPNTWLRTSLVGSPQGYFLTWNPRPGFTYQIQTSTSVRGTWSNVGSPRFSAGSTDSLFVGLQDNAFFRVLLMR